MPNGVDNPNPAVRLPSTGPPTEPSRKPDENSPATRPRAFGGEMRIIRPSEDTVNIAEPIPPSDRNISSCQ